MSEPEVPGKGRAHRDGVGPLARVNAVQGHEAIAATFFTDATPAQKAAVEHDVRSSPIVYKVLKDTIPASVKEIE